jgi:hypothetical protein
MPITRNLRFLALALLAGCAGGGHEPTAGQIAVQPTPAPAEPAANAPPPPVAEPVVKPEVATLKPPAPVAVVPEPKKAAPPPPPPVAAKPAAPPPLDMKSLETRLKDTKAIGVFTKLTLKNQVDDLLAQFRALHQGQAKANMAQLRQSYDLLILKVLALLQEGDPPLAKDIVASREPLWGILTDPVKFASIN